MKKMQNDHRDADAALRVLSEPAARFFKARIGTPTRVQAEAWPRIAAGEDVLLSAPTGTGKTLAAFLVFIDQLTQEAREGGLRDETAVVYISPLKSLAADIRENLRRPLEGMAGAEGIRAAVRTGDTSQSERARMARRPPHILITTPESLFLMLTSRSGQHVLRTARAVILDEIHAMIDTKRGAHLMLSVARLARLCGRPLQRVGLSATIEPLDRAARYLSPRGAAIVAPPMEKPIDIRVRGAQSLRARESNPIWTDIAQAVYERCQGKRSVIAFTEARRYAERLSYGVNQIGGADFSRVHHGSLSHAQRQETEEALRAGRLRLLCATSSMELGIDVGEIDEVLQIGCPRTVSATMQRLGRAGHRPGRVSVMEMYPRTPLEAIRCGLTAQAARMGGVEEASPPQDCLDVLSQHLVSMAALQPYGVDDVMEIVSQTDSFSGVTRQDVKDCLEMLAGGRERGSGMTVRPRILYDPASGRVMGDAYSRMLAVAAGGTIPDKGLYAAKTENGVKIGELDEEFVYETYIGDRFLLGSFAWRVLRINKNDVVVAPAASAGGRIPFWHGETKGRSLKTSLLFGKMMRELGEAHAEGHAREALAALGLDETAAQGGADFIARQIAAVGALPDERTILIERYTDENGNHQLMAHSFFGRRINAPLALLLRHAAQETAQMNVGCVDEEDGFLLYPYGAEPLPEGLLYAVEPDRVRPILEALLMETPLFGMAFRYNAARALMMGMRSRGRQPLWIQRLRGAELLDAVKDDLHHPLIRETRRECLEDQWDIEGVQWLLRQIRAGQIRVREITVDVPSPLSLPLQWRLEAEEMYNYAPIAEGVRQSVHEQLQCAVEPAAQELERVHRRERRPQDAKGLYALLQEEGDFTAQELTAQTLNAPLEWIEALAREGWASYIEPGLWIAPASAEEYRRALEDGDGDALAAVLRRLLEYKGPQTLAQMAERYAQPQPLLQAALDTLGERGVCVVQDGVYISARRYARAQRATIEARRREAPARPPQRYAAYQAAQLDFSAPPEEQLVRAVRMLSGRAFPAALWESVILPQRVRGYRGEMLDKLLARGEILWRMRPDGRVYFIDESQVDYDAPCPSAEDVSQDEAERTVLRELSRRGASFMRPLVRAMEQAGQDALRTQETLIALVRRGLVSADTFAPVRQVLAWERMEKAPLRQRARMRAQAMNTGRWDCVRPEREKTPEERIDALLARETLLCRETFRAALEEGEDGWSGGASWSQALDILRVREYTGRVRRGYFISGLSGAQFVSVQRYDALVYALGQQDKQIRWMSAQDPALAWGRELEAPADAQGRTIRRVSGAAVALCGGAAAMVMEQNGRSIRCMGEEWARDEAFVKDALHALARAFQSGQLYPAQRRLTIKAYDPTLAPALEAAGFERELLDYVLER